MQVHSTTFDRIAQGVDGYAPLNLPLNPIINFTERRDWRYIEPSQVRDVLANYATELEDAATKAVTVISVGVASYWLFVAGIVLVIIGALRLEIRVIGAGVLSELIAWVLAKTTDTKIDRLFSGVWHRVRADLRKALTRQDVAVSVPSVPAGVNVAIDGVCSPY